MDSALSTVLDYPDASLDRAAVAAEAPPGLSAFAAWWSEAPLAEVSARYVAVFDLRGGSSLFLTYHRFGDERERGRALIALKRLYREAGWELDHWELPDYLPLVLELAAADPDVGLPVLREYRPELETIASALRRDSSPWAPVVEHVLSEIGTEALVA